MIKTIEGYTLDPRDPDDHDMLVAVSDGLNQLIVAGESTRQDRFLARAIRRANPRQPGWLERHLLGLEDRPVHNVEIDDYTYDSMIKAVDTNHDFEKLMQGPELVTEHVRYAARVVTELKAATILPFPEPQPPTVLPEVA